MGVREVLLNAGGSDGKKSSGVGWDFCVCAAMCMGFLSSSYGSLLLCVFSFSVFNAMCMFFVIVSADRPPLVVIFVFLTRFT